MTTESWCTREGTILGTKSSISLTIKYLVGIALDSTHLVSSNLGILAAPPFCVCCGGQRCMLCMEAGKRQAASPGGFVRSEKRVCTFIEIAKLPPTLEAGGWRRNELSPFLMPEGDDKDQMQVAESTGESMGRLTVVVVANSNLVGSARTLSLDAWIFFSVSVPSSRFSWCASIRCSRRVPSLAKSDPSHTDGSFYCGGTLSSVNLHR